MRDVGPWGETAGRALATPEATKLGSQAAPEIPSHGGISRILYMVLQMQ